MSKYIVLTEKDQTIRGDLNNFDGTEIIGSGSDFYVWSWTNPDPTDLSTIEGNATYIGTVEIS